ncbi:MAG: glycosyltransferase family 2 protein [Chloroflexaceae bacterium]|nr:glycosyltransferase family 2 protein [Chloroflexaceae bacterium]NJO07165.1 glycosyltransferase family 2 protein [Chloroflexaceae bacterium]
MDVQQEHTLQSLASGTVAVIPAYNEARLIGSVILKARKHFATIIVVDDGSSDDTAEIAHTAGALVVRHETNRGKGAAINTGFLTARGLSPDVVVMMDADGQHLPDEAPAVMAPILRGDADIVIGSRYMQRRSNVPTHRVWGHQVFNFMTSHTSGVMVTDSQSGYRAFSKAALYAITFSSSGFSVESEMQYLARDYNLRVIEVPITILYHEKPKRHVVAHGMKVLNGMLQLIGQYRPLLFFGVPGLLVLVVGLLWGLWVVDIYSRTLQLATGYALISAILVIVGTLSLFTGIMLHSIRAMILEALRKE